MPRVNKIWYRKDTGWWMITLAGKKVRLVEGRQNRKAAEQKFHELAAAQHVSTLSPDARFAINTSTDERLLQNGLLFIACSVT